VSIPRRHREYLPHLALVLTLGLGLWLRFLYVGLPIAEAHSWRQITNADIARNFARHSLNIFYPEASWGGRVGYLGMEFPLLQWITAVLFRGFGESERICRLVSIAFSTGTIALVYLLGARLFGRPVGRAAAFLMAVSPSAVFFGRTFLSDTPMLFFSVAGVLGYVAYADTRRPAAGLAGACCTALAGLVKLPAALIVGPIAWLGWRRQGWRVLRDPWFSVGLGVALASTLAWYVWADHLYHLTGLGQAIWHPSGTYALDIAVAARPMDGVSHWTNYRYLATWDWYTSLGWRIWTLHLTPIGTALALLGLATILRVPGRGVVNVWLFAVAAYTVAAAEGNYFHEFHQLPLLPPAALCFGLAAAKPFDGRWLSQVSRGWWGPVASGAVLLVLALASFNRSGVVPAFFRPQALDYIPISAGASIGPLVGPDALLVVVEYGEYGNNSPILLYRTDRRGWSFDVRSISPHVIERLRGQYGATHFATTIWSTLATQRPDVADYLNAQERVTLPSGTPHDVALFKLR
jgi:4-amino-4-deoxy-L-arabinose transferase-like glycosyltransferase